MNCWSCSSEIGPPRKVLREEICESCNAWVHSCKNCHFWDESGRSCDEPAAEWVHDRERANFCAFFALRSHDAEGRSDGRTSPAAPAGGRDAFERLFKK